MAALEDIPYVMQNIFVNSSRKQKTLAFGILEIEIMIPRTPTVNKYRSSVQLPAEDVAETYHRINFLYPAVDAIIQDFVFGLANKNNKYVVSSL